MNQTSNIAIPSHDDIRQNCLPSSFIAPDLLTFDPKEIAKQSRFPYSLKREPELLAAMIFVINAKPEQTRVMIISNIASMLKVLKKKIVELPRLLISKKLSSQVLTSLVCVKKPQQLQIYLANILPCCQLEALFLPYSYSILRF